MRSGPKRSWRTPLLLVALLCALLLSACAGFAPAADTEVYGGDVSEGRLAPDEAYTSARDVALYLRQYGTLPGNFITKDEAQDLGWQGGGLDDYAPGMSIGGDHFGNYEGSLPDAPGRTWRECDIDTRHASSRGAKRLIYSSDGLVYYTEDHYERFTLLYGEE